MSTAADAAAAGLAESKESESKQWKRTGRESYEELRRSHKYGDA